MAKWKVVGTRSTCGNPPLNTYEATLGVDGNGKTWLCQVNHDMHDGFKTFLVNFDTDECNDNGSPFLRDTVVYADNYWKARKEYHHMVRCEYKEIMNVVEEFIKNHNITKI